MKIRENIFYVQKDIHIHNHINIYICIMLFPYMNIYDLVICVCYYIGLICCNILRYLNIFKLPHSMRNTFFALHDDIFIYIYIYLLYIYILYMFTMTKVIHIKAK